MRLIILILCFLLSFGLVSANAFEFISGYDTYFASTQGDCGDGTCNALERIFGVCPQDCNPDWKNRVVADTECYTISFEEITTKMNERVYANDPHGAALTLEGEEIHDLFFEASLNILEEQEDHLLDQLFLHTLERYEGSFPFNLDDYSNLDVKEYSWEFDEETTNSLTSDTLGFEYSLSDEELDPFVFSEIQDNQIYLTTKYGKTPFDSSVLVYFFNIDFNFEKGNNRFYGSSHVKISPSQVVYGGDSQAVSLISNKVYLDQENLLEDTSLMYSYDYFQTEETASFNYLYWGHWFDELNLDVGDTTFDICEEIPLCAGAVEYGIPISTVFLPSQTDHENFEEIFERNNILFEGTIQELLAEKLDTYQWRIPYIIEIDNYAETMKVCAGEITVAPEVNEKFYGLIENIEFADQSKLNFKQILKGIVSPLR
jgi:hypothetical protein